MTAPEQEEVKKRVKKLKAQISSLKSRNATFAIVRRQDEEQLALAEKHLEALEKLLREVEKGGEPPSPNTV